MRSVPCDDQPFAKAGDELAEKGIDEIGTADRQHHADEAAAAGDQGAGRCVGHVTELVAAASATRSRVSSAICSWPASARDTVVIDRSRWAASSLSVLDRKLLLLQAKLC